jgi:hypothetical protein
MTIESVPRKFANTSFAQRRKRAHPIPAPVRKPSILRLRLREK